MHGPCTCASLAASVTMPAGVCALVETGRAALHTHSGTLKLQQRWDTHYAGIGAGTRAHLTGHMTLLTVLACTVVAR